MATWHQMKYAKRNPTPLWHETKWTVLTDPPGNQRSCMLWDTFAQAEEFLARLDAKGESYSMILPPGGRWPATTQAEGAMPPLQPTE